MAPFGGYAKELREFFDNYAKELRELITEKAPLHENDKKILKEGDVIIQISHNENVSTKTIVSIKTVKQIRTKENACITKDLYFVPAGEEHMRIEAYPYCYRKGTEITESYNECYKIINPERIRETIKKIRQRQRAKQCTDGMESIRETLKLLEYITKEMKQTPKYWFLEMDQRLPAELDETAPEERLKHTKKLEKMLEEEMGKTKASMEEMQKAKELYEYAQNCGVTSEAAKEIYKEKLKELKKEMKKLEL